MRLDPSTNSQSQDMDRLPAPVHERGHRSVRHRAAPDRKFATLSIMGPDIPELLVADAAAWRAWLGKNHANPEGVWLVLAKKGTSGPTTLTYAQALDEALCHGWIDGQTGRRDDDHVPAAVHAAPDAEQLVHAQRRDRRPAARRGPDACRRRGRGRARRRATAAGTPPTPARRRARCRPTSPPHWRPNRVPQRCSRS